jgi:hypothetical protein
MLPPPWRRLRAVGASSGSSFTAAKKCGNGVLYDEVREEEERQEEEERDNEEWEEDSDNEEDWRRAAQWPLPHEDASCNCRGAICSGGSFPSAM